MLNATRSSRATRCPLSIAPSIYPAQLIILRYDRCNDSKMKHCNQLRTHHVAVSVAPKCNGPTVSRKWLEIRYTTSSNNINKTPHDNRSRHVKLSPGILCEHARGHDAGVAPRAELLRAPVVLLVPHGRQRLRRPEHPARVSFMKLHKRYRTRMAPPQHNARSHPHTHLHSTPPLHPLKLGRRTVHTADISECCARCGEEQPTSVPSMSE